MPKPKTIILYTDGINTDYETKYAMEQAGAEAEVVHLNDLINKEKNLKDYQILFFPGGFSYGDDVMSGKIFAKMLINHFLEDLQKFITADKLVIGICNGFQIIVRLGLLPFRQVGIEQPEAALCQNASGHHEDHWVRMRVNENNSIFFRGMEGMIIESPVAHGEGRFVAPAETMNKLQAKHQIVLRYVDHDGKNTQEYPHNPNGSTNGIAGISDETGRIFGMMPHPERFCKLTNHPNWHSIPQNQKPDGMLILENAVKYFE
jgi:phosphoribosylformylglycinamidine synthase